MKRKTITILIVYTSLAIFINNLNASTYTVTNSADSGNGTLRNIIGSTVDGDKVNFDAGITNIIINSDININTSIDVKGSGREGLNIDGNAATRIFNISSANKSIIISDMTISNCIGETDGGAIFFGTGTNSYLIISNCLITTCSVTGDGGAVSLNGTDTKIINTTITNCVAGIYGGAVHADNGVNLTMTDCIISENTSSNYGGGIYIAINANKASLTNCTIINNSTTPRYGGGIYCRALLTINDSTISGNTSENRGGGIYFDVQDQAITNTIENCIISNNTASTLGGGIGSYKTHFNISNSVIIANNATNSYGGGIYINAANQEWNTYIYNSKVLDNLAADNGGGMYITDQNIWIYNSTFSGNSATNNTADGGGIFSGGGQSYLFIDSSLFYNNNASDDGGAMSIVDPAVLQNCTISENTSSDRGGGIHINSSGTETQKFYNCTVYNNTCATTTEGGGFYRNNGSVEIYNSIIASNNPSSDIAGNINVIEYSLYNNTDNLGAPTLTGNKNGNPRVYQLENNGGITLTHALKINSPAINLGQTTSLLTYDQRGVGYDRVIGGNVDAGAYELGKVIGDFIWYDLNGDGTQDTDERGITNVTMELYDSGASILETAITDDEGIYIFTNFTTGTFTVKVITNSLPTGLENNPTYDRDGTLDNETTVTIASGEHILDADFGYDNYPNLVVISGFIAKTTNGKVHVSWNVDVEVGTIGYYIERQFNDNWVRVNKNIIYVPPFRNSDPPYKYDIIDNDVLSGNKYTWRIVEQNNQGHLLYYGPYSATVDGTAISYELWATNFNWGSNDSSKSGDADHDGMNNYEEYLAGTNPFDVNSLLKVYSLSKDNNDNYIICWESTSNKTYSIEFCPSLKSGWLPIINNIKSTPPINTNTIMINSTNSIQMFFRIITK